MMESNEEILLNYLRDNAEWYHTTCFEKIRDNFYGDKYNNVELMSFTIEGNNDEMVISAEDSDFLLNLELSLDYFEEVENYEMCSDLQKLMDEISNYKGEYKEYSDG